MVTRQLHTRLDEIHGDLIDIWVELDVTRQKWIEDPLNPILASHLRELEEKTSKLEVSFKKTAVELYGSWYGIDE